MSKKHPKKPGRTPPPFPSREELLEYIQENPTRVGKREIARAFSLTADQKITLKRVLKELASEGLIQKGRGKRFTEPGRLPEVLVLRVVGPDVDGELIAEPMTWAEEQGPVPKVYMAPERRGQSALGPGDRVLARLSPIDKKAYEGRTIKRLTDTAPEVLGVFQMTEGEPRIRPVDRKARYDYVVGESDTMDAEPGELVWAEVLPGRALGLKRAKVTDKLGSTESPKAISLIAIHDHDIPMTFPDDAVRDAEAAIAAPLGKRADLRDVPLVTIDGADARDFDDAVFAEPDEDTNNPGGWHLIVAIADVSWYVRPDAPLDKEAYKRGNSVYFPDRVVPMLPEALSNGWCSLVPNEDRPCLAAHMWIDADGKLLRHRFERALMRSHARLTYEQAQAAADGESDDTTTPLIEGVITPLYGAYASLSKGREARGVLDLDLPERRVEVDESGAVTRIGVRARLDSHKLIEEFMITANVAAAQELEKRKQPCMYRIHDEPGKEKIEELRRFLETIDIPFAKGQVVRPEHFNRILERVKDGPNAHMVNEVVLRSQSQAEYAPGNIGHFGLALVKYCHFTSPIRRYADLLVHRALIRGDKLGDGALEGDGGDFDTLGEHISMTERRAAKAERDAVNRFTAAYLAERIGAEFPGRINGVTRFGLFVTLEETGADGLIPIRTLPDDYYVHDEALHLLRGRATKRTFRLGDAINIELVEADPITGSMVFALAGEEAGGERPPRGGGRGQPKTGTKKAKGKGGRKKGTSRAARRRARL